MGTVLFDFDGTLAHRPGIWSGCLVEVLDEVSPGHGITVDEIRPRLRDGFPWHDPEHDHLHLSTPDLWWDNLQPVFHRAYLAAGIGPSVATTGAAGVRARYCDPEGFVVFPDTVDALIELRRSGWKVIVLSNHVPELAAIIDGLGLATSVDDVFSSAVTGYEKPHPNAFAAALGAAPPDRCFMVGDSPGADVLGAVAVGVPAILVRRPDIDAERSAPDLAGAVRLVLGR